MIAKQYRLSERGVKKVLRTGKPFFSRICVFNVMQNSVGHNRYAIVIGGKSVKTAICRNFFRRSYYEKMNIQLDSKNESGRDIVCVIKKQTKLDQNDQKNVAIFKKEIDFLVNKIFK